MDVKVVNPFLNATLDTFEQMFAIKPAHKEPYLLSPNSGHPWEVSGLLGITGDHCGIVAFRLTKLLAYKLLELSGLTNIRPDERQELSQQLVSEFTNIISGTAVSNIKDMDLDVSPPVTIVGHNHYIAWPKNYPVVGIPFNTQYGAYEIDVCFKG